MFSNSQLTDLPQAMRLAPPQFTPEVTRSVHNMPFPPRGGRSFRQLDRSSSDRPSACRPHYAGCAQTTIESFFSCSYHCLHLQSGAFSPACRPQYTSSKKALIYIAVTILYLLHRQSRRLSCGFVRPRCEGTPPSTELLPSFLHPHWSSSPSSEVHPEADLGA